MFMKEWFKKILIIGSPTKVRSLQKISFHSISGIVDKLKRFSYRIPGQRTQLFRKPFSKRNMDLPRSSCKKERGDKHFCLFS